MSDEIKVTVHTNNVTNRTILEYSIPAFSALNYNALAEIPHRAVAAIVEIIANGYIAERKAEVLEAISPQAVANLAIAKAANRIADIFNEQSEAKKK